MHLVNNKKVRGISRLSSEPKPICGECMRSKQTKNSHKKVKEIKTTRPLDFFHMNLMCPMRTESRGGKRYVLVVFDDFPRYSFVSFLIEKSKTIEHLKSLFTRIQVGIGHAICKDKSDRRKEFENVDVDFFCVLISNMNLQPLEFLNKIKWLKGKIVL